MTTPVLTRRQLNRVVQKGSPPGVLTITTRPLPRRDATAVEAEAHRFIEFASPGCRHDVVVTVPE